MKHIKHAIKYLWATWCRDRGTKVTMKAKHRQLAKEVGMEWKL